jgi:hypothetical protein
MLFDDEIIRPSSVRIGVPGDKVSFRRTMKLVS